ncbi:hypothetical protein GCM10009416_40160 [Craurococcus roseus]|uniref:Uncharacterized protein n=1 Tax=Craurococcus roseus TaxID=77585 RepID=A0ABN1FU57_9PROT
MRFGYGFAACGALAAFLLAADPAAAQQQQQQQAPAAGGGAAAENAYATQLRDTEARLGRAIEQAQGGAGRTQAGAMPPGQQQLMDATQAAWQAMQSGAPEEMRGASGPYADADRTFRRAVEAMRVGQTPPDQAVTAAREAHAALGKLREAAARQGGGAGTGASSAPSPAASGQGPMQEPPRR